MYPSTFISKETISDLTARMLLEINAVNFNSEKPFKLTSGLRSPVYIDCRKLISYPRIREVLMEFAVYSILFLILFLGVLFNLKITNKRKVNETKEKLK